MHPWLRVKASPQVKNSAGALTVILMGKKIKTMKTNSNTFRASCVNHVLVLLREKHLAYKVRKLLACSAVIGGFPGDAFESPWFSR